VRLEGSLGAMTDRMLVYHNPVCGQSRGALEILDERGVEYDVVEYLKSPLDRADFERILAAIPDEPAELVRKDKRFAELGLNESDYQTAEAVVEVLLEHPELMQRPVVFKGDDALICRPSAKVLGLLGE
jgi:arsenate reductase